MLTEGVRTIPLFWNGKYEAVRFCLTACALILATVPQARVEAPLERAPYPWRQALPLNSQQVIDGSGMHGLKARNAFFRPSQRKMFSNEVTDASDRSG